MPKISDFLVVRRERIEVPGTGLDEIKGLKSWDSYSHLERDGLPVPEQELTSEEGNRSILVGKTSPPRFLEEAHGAFLQAQERRESSMQVRHGEKGWVDNVYVTESLDSGRLVRITLRTNKIQSWAISSLVDTGKRESLGDWLIRRICLSPSTV